MSKSISISKARSELPELIRYLRRSPHEAVFIEHRDMNERLVLITESRLRYLESRVTAAAKQTGSSFKLAGSMESDLSDDELERALAVLKKEGARHSEAKAEKL